MNSFFAIICVSDLTNPGTPVDKETKGSAHCIAVIGNYAYVAEGIGDGYNGYKYFSGLSVIPVTPIFTITAGSTTGTITFTGIDDTTDEADETIIVTPSTSPTNATSSI